MGKNNKLANDLTFEIKCREILLKRLETPLGALARVVDKENTARQERYAELSVYQTEQEAHEAYGYKYITWAEYEEIKKRFDDVEHAEHNAATVTAAALDMLREFTGRLKSDIRHFQWSALPDEEKQRIERENTEVRERVRKRRGIV